MNNGMDSGSLLRGGAAAAFVLLATAFVASGAAVGGGYWPALGTGKVAVKGGGIKPMPFFANLRFAFDGSPADASGTGTIRAYDAIGQTLLDQIPFAWTTRNGAAFKLDLSGKGFEDFLAARIADATGGTAAVTVESTAGKGALLHGGTSVRASASASGEVSLDGAPPRRFHLSLHVK
jgi:hypothetical protein